MTSWPSPFYPFIVKAPDSVSSDVLLFVFLLLLLQLYSTPSGYRRLRTVRMRDHNKTTKIWVHFIYKVIKNLKTYLIFNSGGTGEQLGTAVLWMCLLTWTELLIMGENSNRLQYGEKGPFVCVFGGLEVFVWQWVCASGSTISGC